MQNSSNKINEKYSSTFNNKQFLALIFSVVINIQAIIYSNNTYANEIDVSSNDSKENSKIDIKDYIGDIIKNNQTKFLMDKNLEFIGHSELQGFINFFKLKSETEVFIKIFEIQNDNKLNIDGIIGPETLKNIYKIYYSKNKDKLSNAQLKRLKISENIESFSKDRPNKKISLPNIFNNVIYYGANIGENIDGTLFNKELFNKKIYETERIDKKNEIIIKKVNGQFHLIVYIDGKLSLLTYTSPGGEHKDEKTGKKRKYSTPIGNYIPLGLDINHFSSSYPKNKKGANGGAPMFYGINFNNNNYWFHIGYVDGYNQSHGCCRLPALYAEGLYYLVKNNGFKNFNISIIDN